jgi:single-strand DNA-binding protein
MSALNLNKAIISGHIVHTPELKQTPGGIATTSFTIAVNRRFEKDGKREADFINVVAWRQTAEFVCRYFGKGTAICVAGSIQTRKWTDKEGGTSYATEIVADEVFFVDGKTDTETENKAQKQTSQPSVTPKFETIDTDEGLPF